MDRLIQFTSAMRASIRAGLFIVVQITFGLPSVSAFELLSEGAMDSVSAVSAQSVEELINIAGSPAAGLSDDYESLPFQTRIEVVEGSVDEVKTELDFELIKEVETWARVLREQGERQLEVGFVDELPPAPIDIDPFVFEDQAIIEFTPGGDGENDDDRTTFRQGRITQTFELLDSGVDSITTRFERYVESAATINANPGNSNTSIGSGFITDVRSTSTQTYSNYRDADRPLF